MPQFKTYDSGAYIVSYYEKVARKARVRHMVDGLTTRKDAEEVCAELLAREGISDIILHECSKQEYVSQG